MPNLRSIDTDRTFAIFFAEELNIDIDDPIYSSV